MLTTPLARIAGLAALLSILAFNTPLGAEPQYGGHLNVGTVNITLAPLSWDPADWVWKSNHDTSMVREQLFVGNLDLSAKKGGPFHFIADAYLPKAAIRGELAESWRWLDPLTLEIKLRRGVIIPATDGVIERRELDAHDVVYSFDNLQTSPKKLRDYLDHMHLEVIDSHTLLMHFKEFNAEWDYRFGYGYYSAIVPRETEHLDAKNWRNVVGSGPFKMAQYVHGNSQTYVKNEHYWDRERLAQTAYKIPFIDKLTYRIIKDEATYLTALRTGKLDILENIRWIAVDHLKATTPELKWNRWLGTAGNFVALRQDFPPFADVRVRRALNLAVNQREIVDLFYGGHAELMAFPQHPGFGAYFEPLDTMPDSVQELFSYDPERARALLKEAGYPDGFDVTMQVCTCNPTSMDLIPLLERYFADVGVRLTIQPLEYASFLSMMTTRNHSPAYLMFSGHVNPTTTIRKNFMTGQLWNPSLHSDPSIDARMTEVFRTRDEASRIVKLKALTRDVLDAAPYIWLPTQYYYTAWWPWVKNYNGELRVGAVRPGPIYARIWIDQTLKKSLGF